MKNKSDNFIVPHGSYPFDVMVSIAENDDTLLKKLKKHGVNIAEFDTFDLRRQPGKQGRCVMFSGRQTLLRLYRWPKYPEDYGYLSHEIFHAVEFLFDTIGLKHSVDSGEAFAYQIQHITTEIFKKLKK